MTEAKEDKKRFRQIVRSARSSREIEEKINQESEPIRSRLLEQYERWRTGKHENLADHVPNWFFEIIVRGLFLLSPLIALVLNTLRALNDGYRETKLLQDPGHRRIRIYDKLIALASLVVGLFTVLIANDIDLDTLSESKVVWIVLFPQLSGWTSFFILYGITALLQFYDVRRSQIIRTINEQQKVW